MPAIHEKRKQVLRIPTENKKSMARKTLLVLLYILCPMLLSPLAGHAQARDCIRQHTSIHAQWDRLLKKYVDKNGLVDYKGFMADSTSLNAYLNQLTTHIPNPSADKREQLAYYINLYNAATVKLVLDHYPLHSIKDIRNPWDRKWIPVGGNLRSLGYLEHQILRKMDEPRIHFAINCASYSCPKLLNQAYTAKGLEAQLDNASRDFILDSARNRIGSDKLELSQLFNWYKKDFTRNASLIAFLAPYVQIPIHATAKISFLTYDWNLNEAQ